jgi:hypothetical protein
MLDSVSNEPKILSILALIIGLGYLFWAEVDGFKNKK